jgi:hypothetical protein
MLHEWPPFIQPAERSGLVRTETTPIVEPEQDHPRPNCVEEGIQHTEPAMIRKLQSGKYRLYSRKINPKTGKRRNLGTFKSRAAAEKHERDVQYFKRH